MLICSECSAVAMAFASEGDTCFARRCNGKLKDWDRSAPDESQSHEATHGVMETAVAVLEAPEEAEQAETECDEREDEDIEVDVDSPLSLRRQAVAVAHDILKRRKNGLPPAELGDLKEVREKFRDLGSIHRPARGYPDMAKAREQHKGQFFTSVTVGDLIWRLVKPGVGRRVLESCIGSGNLIAQPDEVFVTGMDVDPEAVDVARALLGPQHSLICDEMQHHQFDQEFELVIGNPPYSVPVRDRAKLWAHSVGWDGWGRAEVVWLEQAAMAVKRPGVVAAVLPIGIYELLTPKFVRWLESKMTLAAEIILPKAEAHDFSQWPVSLYIWVAGVEGTGETRVWECESLSGWIETDQGQAVEQYVDGLMKDAWSKWPTHEGPVHARVWQPEERKRGGKKGGSLPMSAQDAVVIQQVNGKMSIAPKTVGARAKVALARLELGYRFDRKTEKHISRWDEMVCGPPLLNIGDVMRRLNLYGLDVRVDRSMKSWLKRRYRWYRRQMSPVPRWVRKEGGNG